MSTFRATRAKLVLARCAFYASMSPNDPALIRDLVCDLAHYADQETLDFTELIRKGLEDYAAGIRPHLIEPPTSTIILKQ